MVGLNRSDIKVSPSISSYSTNLGSSSPSQSLVSLRRTIMSLHYMPLHATRRRMYLPSFTIAHLTGDRRTLDAPQNRILCFHRSKGKR
jgi:hypothetical protein